MDGHGRSTTAGVAELRLRLYRPDPPAGAVAAYLAALRTQPSLGAAGPAPAAAPRPHGRAMAALGVGVGVVAAALVATQVGRQVPTLVAAPTVEVASSASSRSTAAIPEPPLMGVPLGDLSGSGRASGRFDANGHLVVASVLCSGVGTLSVRIGTAPPTLLSCVQGPPALAIVAGTGRLDRFTIVVDTDEPIRWSLAAAALDR